MKQLKQRVRRNKDKISYIHNTRNLGGSCYRQKPRHGPRLKTERPKPIMKTIMELLQEKSQGKFDGPRPVRRTSPNTNWKKVNMNMVKILKARGMSLESCKVWTSPKALTSPNQSSFSANPLKELLNNEDLKNRFHPG